MLSRTCWWVKKTYYIQLKSLFLCKKTVTTIETLVNSLHFWLRISISRFFCIICELMTNKIKLSLTELIEICSKLYAYRPNYFKTHTCHCLNYTCGLWIIVARETGQIGKIVLYSQSLYCWCEECDFTSIFTPAKPFFKTMCVHFECSQVHVGWLYS